MFHPHHLLKSLFLFLSFFSYAQISVSGNFSMKPDSYEAMVIDSSYQNIYYKAEFVKDPKKKKLETTCVLQIGKKFSKFSDFNVLRKDSLMEKYSHLEKIGAKELGQSLNLAEKWRSILIKNFQENNITVQDKTNITYQYEEKQPALDWKLENETREILGYICHKATTKYRGRKYAAWYCKEIPINNGPYIFQNLPGLILELEDSDNNFHFTAIAMDKKINGVYLRNEKRILHITREQFRKALQTYHDNPGFFHGKAYNEDGSQIAVKSPPLPYNPIELE
ncbi:GLPGLI family protein [Chryseobacterium gambrini]|uniref:GLPGLI family protein n=2 Tax=Chryseobacterium gambrini TaxID=373672 RepID=A0A1N7JUQ0_9FLAO|nr:GLPGLI family protein [Chryseobacterium gambrini]SIS53060.1 GLPGLI family protein [Chryseobacterium gambrini]